MKKLLIIALLCFLLLGCKGKEEKVELEEISIFGDEAAKSGSLFEEDASSTGDLFGGEAAASGNVFETQ